ncbi:hypothetical protein B0H21DRAFT_720495, partial [Amylocystis lapponica]
YDDDDDSFLYGETKDAPEVVKPEVVQTTVSPSYCLASISLEQTRSATQGLVAHLEAEAAIATNGDTMLEVMEAHNEVDGEAAAEGEGEAEGEAEGNVAEDEDEDSDDDVEIIMEQPARSLDFRCSGRPTGNRPTSATFNTPTRAPQQPPPSLTTEYTPRERGGITKLSSTPQPSSSTPVPASASTSTTQRTEGEAPPADTGPDPSTLPIVTAPPSHPSIDPTATGMLDGRSIFEVDMNALADKSWRRPGSDLSDWFNYGFDEISWEAYCYRRREIGDLANFAGMPEEQLTALPSEIRSMVMAGATAMMANGGAGPSGPGMLAPGGGMNMNGGAMMNQMMNMGQMMNPMMHDMSGVGGMDMNGGLQMSMGGPGMQMGGPSGPGMMQDGSGQGVPVGGGPQGGVQGAPDQQMSMGDGFGPGPGQGMMNMGVGEFGMQDPTAMGQQMGQQMYQGMEGNGGTPVPVPVPVRGGGRNMPLQNAGMRGRNSFPGRGRVPPVRPASPLPPNVPTGPRNKNKYKDIDGSAPAVDGLDYGGGGMKEGGRGTPDQDDRGSRKRRGSPGMDEGRGPKRR